MAWNISHCIHHSALIAYTHTHNTHHAKVCKWIVLVCFFFRFSLYCILYIFLIGIFSLFKPCRQWHFIFAYITYISFAHFAHCLSRRLSESGETKFFIYLHLNELEYNKMFQTQLHIEWTDERTNTQNVVKNVLKVCTALVPSAVYRGKHLMPKYHSFSVYCVCVCVVSTLYLMPLCSTQYPLIQSRT